MLFVANAATGAKSLAEAIAQVKAKPDSLIIGSPSRGSVPHLAAELLALGAKAEFRTVPMSSSGQAIQAIVNGDSQVSVDGIAALLPHVKSGRLRALGVTSQRPLPGLEGIPLAKDTVPGLVVTGWFMLFAPKGTPAAAVAALNTAVNAALASPEAAGKLQAMATYPVGGSVADARSFLRRERTLAADAVKRAGLQPE
jgi:tripartite-type tricarboxylate transporter receptor subunit TctC